MTNEMRKLVWLLSALLLAAGAGAGGWWWHFNTRPDRRLQRGLEACRQGDFDRAAELAVALEASEAPSHAALLRAEILLRRARPYVEANRRDEAQPLLEGVVREIRKIEDPGPWRADAAAVYGQALHYLGRQQLAEQALLVAVSECPEHADAHRALAVLYYDQGALELALNHLREVSRLDPQDGRPERLMGRIYRDMDQRLEAVSCYEEALRRHLSPAHREQALTELAALLVHAADFSRAAKVLDQLDPETAGEEVPTLLRAECLAVKGHTDRLRRLLEKGLRLYPRCSRLLQLRAQLLIEEGKLKEALPLLEQAARSAPRDPACRFELGRLYRRLGREADAKEQDRLGEESRSLMVQMNQLSQRASVNPWDASVRLQLAETCHKLGIPELEQMWRQAAAACPPPRRVGSRPRRRTLPPSS